MGSVRPGGPYGPGGSDAASVSVQYPLAGRKAKVSGGVDIRRLLAIPMIHGIERKLRREREHAMKGVARLVPLGAVCGRRGLAQRLSEHRRNRRRCPFPRSGILSRHAPRQSSAAPGDEAMVPSPALYPAAPSRSFAPSRVPARCAWAARRHPVRSRVPYEVRLRLARRPASLCDRARRTVHQVGLLLYE